MATRLYDATVSTFVQGLGGLERVLSCGLEHCLEQGRDAGELVEARLIDDMNPLRFQILSSVLHSVGAIEGVRTGSFCPFANGTDDYAGMQVAVTQAREALGGVSPEEVNGLEGRHVLFQAGEIKRSFMAEDFLLSLAIPTFYFHVSMTYAILRSLGVPLGKRDFLGRVRIIV